LDECFWLHCDPFFTCVPDKYTYMLTLPGSHPEKALGDKKYWTVFLDYKNNEFRVGGVNLF